MKVYFGGTFDPPHLGHHEILLSLLRDDWTTKVFVVPTSQNPLKNPDPRAELFQSRSKRLEWMQLWMDEVKKEVPFHLHSKLSLELCEFEREGPAYTIDTLKTLMTREGSAPRSWALAIGGDTVAGLEKWKSIEELLPLLHSLWIYPRGKQLSPLLDIATPLRGLTEFRIMNERVRDVSSTEIRQLIVEGRLSEAASRVPLLPVILKNLESSLR